MNIRVLWQLLLGAVSVSAIVQDVEDPSQTVVVDLGANQQLKGLNVSLPSGVNVYTFYGIPYALPPLGNLRFQPPKPALDWTGIRDAVSKSAVCPQFTFEDLTSVKSEDCLYLNVFTPDVNASLPVFVWIHGGAFLIGSAYQDGDGDTFASQGVVAVTINYRLGALGFLTTEDDVMPGNYGLLDQVLALKWVQKHISAFGGDPAQVTIGGESAGAFSVSLLVVSPLTKGLFIRAIMESGSSLSLSAVERMGSGDKARDSTFRSAARVGCHRTTSAEILQCLQAVNVDALRLATMDASTVPRVESKFGFLPDYPLNLLKTGHYNKVDTLHGTNSGDFSEFIQDPEDDGITRQEFQSFVKGELESFSNTEDLVQELVDAYIGNETDPLVLRSILVQEVVDWVFGGGSLTEITKYTKAPDVATKHFLYQFYYRISGTSTPAWRGVAHAAELRFVFYPDSRYNYSTADDRAVGRQVQTMWANFIKYGDPTPSSVPKASSVGPSLVKWEPFTLAQPNMLEIDVVSKLVTYPRLFLIDLYERILELANSAPQESPIVG
ncbi:unnamed protein product [Candidula unifasciata]|uniref:Carboxylic ester hydrolase n=1 Tax=Candidula unifasciata TaxID=100452 RepID=A0A8S3ZNG0_9EUPU|nr:unnamed protein product [Candidula unifasciata]